VTNKPWVTVRASGSLVLFYHGSSPPHLHIKSTSNTRLLLWKDLHKQGFRRTYPDSYRDF